MRSNSVAPQVPCLIGISIVARSMRVATGLRSLPNVSNPRRADSQKGCCPPPAVGSRTVGEVRPTDGTFLRKTSGRSTSVGIGEGTGVAVGIGSESNTMRGQPSMRLFAATASPCIPSICRNLPWSASSGSSDARTAAREATKGRRAHHTCRRLGAEMASSASARADFRCQARQSVTRFQSAGVSSHTRFGNQRIKPSPSLANQVKPLVEYCHLLIHVRCVSDQCRCSTCRGHGPAS
jgi:hypothetical protein